MSLLLQPELLPPPPRASRRRGHRSVALVTAAALTGLGLLSNVVPSASAAVDAGPVVSWGYGPGAPESLQVTGAVAIDAGNFQGLAVTQAGTVVTWGDGSYGLSDLPAALNGKRVTAVAAGAAHSLALTSDNEIVGWGTDDYGQIDAPAALEGKTITALSAGSYHNLALTSDNQIVGWGSNSQGESTIPPSLTGRRVTAISAGAFYSLALTEDGQITAWGNNGFSQTAVPAPPAGETYTAVSAGWFGGMALTSAGKVVAWGGNGSGQTDVPASLADKTVTAISAGYSYNLALTDDGRVTAWGDNSYGQATPPASLDGQKVAVIAAGGAIGAALVQGSAPVVTSSPTTPAEVEAGASVSLTAMSTGAPTPTVQWQRAGSADEKFTDVEGATSPTYTFDASAADDGARYQAVFTNANGSATSTPATLSVNSPPTAKNLTITAEYETAKTVTLLGTDANDDKLTYTVVDAPTHGVLSGDAPELTYTPAQGFDGDDSFTYRVDDGRVDSTVATVDITVLEKPNTPPVAKDLTISAGYETATPVTLGGSDVDGDTLTYDVTDKPNHGELSGTAPNLSYVADDGYDGEDSFTYTVNDGTVDSDEATAHITVGKKPNDVPVATSFDVIAPYETGTRITLSGSDPDHDPLGYEVTDKPDHGQLTGDAPELTFTPNKGYDGPDSFSYTVNDGTETSVPAKVSITVSEKPNGVPVAKDLDVTTAYETDADVALDGTDPDGDELTYDVTDQPNHGELSGTGADLTYTPDDGFEGEDEFEYTVDDGTDESDEATVSITVTEKPNGVPVANNLQVTAGFESATAVALDATDPDGDTLTYAVVSQPDHGTLSGSGKALSYTPDDGFTGDDAFTYRVNDGAADSTIATVELTVTAQSCVPDVAKREFSVDVDQRDGDGKVHTAKFTTKKAGELLLAYVAVNGPSTGTQSVKGITGGGLTWTMVQRDNTRGGTSEIWQAYAPSKLRSTSVEATLAAKGYSVTMTVAGFSGARPSVGAAGHASGTASAPRVALTPQASGSVVWAVGRVVGSRYDPKPVSGQKVVHDETFRSPSTGYWVQRTTRDITSGTPVTVSDRSTAKSWGYAAVEIRGVCD